VVGGICLAFDFLDTNITDRVVSQIKMRIYIIISGMKLIFSLDSLAIKSEIEVHNCSLPQIVPHGLVIHCDGMRY
jgi:hypothetical protein